MLRVVIIDDEKNARDVISTIIAKRCKQAEVVGEADSVKSGIEAINKHEPDLVLLDINLQEGTGFDVLKAVESDKFKIIFITAYEEFALKAFKFSAIDYILKPINSIELAESINKFADNFQKTTSIEVNALQANYSAKNKDTKKIVLKTLDSIYSVAVKDIIRCESDTYYTKFYLQDGQVIMVSSTLKEYDEMLSEFGFFRVHQSHLINLDYFVRFKKADGGFAVLKDNSEIPVALRKKDQFLQAIVNL